MQPLHDAGQADAPPVRSHVTARVVGDRRVASTRHRVLAHLGALREAGFDVEVEYQVEAPKRWLRIPYRLRELWLDTRPPSDSDLVFVHRRTYPPFFSRRLSRVGVPVVFDLDDALYLPPPSADQGAATRRRYRRNFEATAAAADLVVCGNEEVTAHVPHGRTAVIPTAVDCRVFRPGAAAPAAGPVVGWVGHSDNLPYLEALASPLRELASRLPGLRLVVVADRAPSIDGVDIEFRKWSLDREVACFDGIGVGVMPLADSPWARAKCAFKLLQYMALGIPAVASPVGVNRDLVQDGQNGFLALDDDEWFERLQGLLVDSELRQRIAGAGRRTVETQYSLDVISPRLVNLLVEVTARPSGSAWPRNPTLP